MPNEILIKTVLNKTKQRDPWFLDDYTVNPYSACSFNCLYCYIRGSKYGEHMEERLAVKINALEILEKQLAARAKKHQYGYIVLSSATDPYLQVESKYELTRKLLETIHHYKFPVHIITKSELVTRDFDLLHEIKKDAILPTDLETTGIAKVFITFSFSTLDDQVGKIFEPGAPAPTKRIGALEQSLINGFHSGVSLMPLLPYITDTEEQLHNLFRTFQQLGVRYIFPASITLFGAGPHDSKPLMLTAIKKHYPHLEEKYKELFTHGTQPPSWYRNAFNAKVRGISERYGIKNNLLPG
jgi:DNA repair photolyase